MICHHNNSEKILVSACLLGVNCRYDGKNAFRKEIRTLCKKNYVLFACPEQLGGLTTPRPRSMIKGERIFSESGEDITKKFYRGAREFIKIIRKFGVKRLILKSKSPSCGKKGVVTKLLPRGIKVTYF